MALTIIDALKEKGSTGGNNIAEAVANLPAGGSGGESCGAVKVVSFKDASHLNANAKDIGKSMTDGQIVVLMYQASENIAYYLLRSMAMPSNYMKVTFKALFGAELPTYPEYFYFKASNPDDDMIKYDGVDS